MSHGWRAVQPEVSGSSEGSIETLHCIYSGRRGTHEKLGEVITYRSSPSLLGKPLLDSPTRGQSRGDDGCGYRKEWKRPLTTGPRPVTSCEHLLSPRTYLSIRISKQRYTTCLRYLGMYLDNWYPVTYARCTHLTPMNSSSASLPPPPSLYVPYSYHLRNSSANK